MLSFREIQNCEGYYYNVKTGDILRNVGPGEARCWSEGSWQETTAADDPEAEQFLLLTRDVTEPFEAVLRLVVERHGALSPRQIVNRQAATQPDGEVVTEESVLHPGRAETNQAPGSVNRASR